MGWSLLINFEKNSQNLQNGRLELPLFHGADAEDNHADSINLSPPAFVSTLSSIVDQLTALNLDELSPRQAMEELHKLKSLLID